VLSSSPFTCARMMTLVSRTATPIARVMATRRSVRTRATMPVASVRANGDASANAASSRRHAMVAFLASSATLTHAYASAARGLPTFECASEPTTSKSGLAYCDAVVGEGASPVKGQTIKAHYTGRLENGRVFDSSYERGSPLTFRADQVIKGWGLGILGDDDVPAMKVGGKRKLIIPADLGYGARGAGGVIPGGATLYFDVELVAIL
jgi:peptidylprolyl isomerase